MLPWPHLEETLSPSPRGAGGSHPGPLQHEEATPDAPSTWYPGEGDSSRLPGSGLCLPPSPTHKRTPAPSTKEPALLIVPSPGNSPSGPQQPFQSLAVAPL